MNLCVVSHKQSPREIIDRTDRFFFFPGPETMSFCWFQQQETTVKVLVQYIPTQPDPIELFCFASSGENVYFFAFI